MKLKHWIRLGAFALTSFWVLSFLTGFLCVTDPVDMHRMYGFYLEPKNSIDVAFIGNSHVFTGFYSPLAYEKYGFTSYALSVRGMKASCFKSAIEEMRARQEPQLYVIEVDGLGEKYQFNDATRRWIDTMRDSKNRTRTIRELVQDPEEWNEYQVRYQKYHMNWSNLKQCVQVFREKREMDARGYSIVKSFDTQTNGLPEGDDVNELGVNDDAMRCLEDLIAYLKENQITNVLFLRIPTALTYDEKESFGAAIDYIEQSGYPYLDLNARQEEIGLVAATDYYNRGHNNIYGAEKVTNYLGQYIVDHYDLDLDHTDAVTAQWDDCASHNDKILTTLKARTDQSEGVYYCSDAMVAAVN